MHTLLFAFPLLLSLAGVPRPLAQEPAHDHASPERMAAIVTALAIRAGSTVADVGAGGGDYTIKLAPVVGAAGRVLAVDINDSALARLTRRLEAAAITNVRPIKGAIDNPNLPAGVDAALIVNAYHEMTEHQSMLRAIRAALKPGGRLVILEPITAEARTRSRDDQAWRHQIAPELVVRDVRDAGFDIIALEDPFRGAHSHDGQTEWMLIAVPSKASSSGQ